NKAKGDYVLSGVATLVLAKEIDAAILNTNITTINAAPVKEVSDVFRRTRYMKGNEEAVRAVCRLINSHASHEKGLEKLKAPGVSREHLVKKIEHERGH